MNDPNAGYVSRVFEADEPEAGSYGSDWLSRVIIPDLYPRLSDPFRPGALVIPGAPPNPELAPVVEVPTNIIGTLTPPAQRPFVVQRGINFQLTANVTPVALVNQQFYCDSIVIGVPSTAANSVFLGYSSAVTTGSGIELFPGVPVTLIPPNSREQWELQRALEFIANLMARNNGIPDLGMYRAPRVVFDANDLFVVATAATAVAVMMFYVPEMQ